MGRVVVITGGTSGIGLELKNLFESNGDTVLTISTRTMDSPYHYVASVSDEGKLEEVVDKIAKEYGKIDILVANAGFGMSGITELIPTNDIKSLTEVNYYGTLYLIRSALKYMDRGAKIVTVSSAMALFPVPFRSIYGSVKSAVLSLSFSLRMELEPLGISVVSICPGDIKTNFTSNRLKDFQTSDRYGTRLETATEKSDSREDKRIPANVCGKKMFKIINKKRPRPFYIIGGKYKVLYFLTRITPKSWLLKMTNKLYGGK